MTCQTDLNDRLANTPATSARFSPAAVRAQRAPLPIFATDGMNQRQVAIAPARETGRGDTSVWLFEGGVGFDPFVHFLYDDRRRGGKKSAVGVVDRRSSLYLS